MFRIIILPILTIFLVFHFNIIIHASACTEQVSKVATLLLLDEAPGCALSRGKKRRERRRDGGVEGWRGG